MLTLIAGLLNNDKSMYKDLTKREERMSSIKGSIALSVFVWSGVFVFCISLLALLASVDALLTVLVYK